MTLLIWLAATSLLWGGVLWIAGRALQRSTNVSGAARQWIWRGATVLLLAPWIAAPFVVMFGLGLAPAETVATTTVSTMPSAEIMAGLTALDAAGVQTQVVSDGGGVMSWLSARSLPEFLLIALIGGWLVRFVLAQLALRSLLGIVNMSREAEPGVAKSFVQVWATRLKLRPAPRLRVVAEQHSPFSYGVLRPTICVPEGMEDKLSRGSLDLVIGHESLHVARGDGWLRPVERVTADVLWFNPFAWLIRRELDVARELAVDEAVLAMSNARVAYARTLRDVAGFAAGLPAAVPAASMSLPGGRDLMLRVSRTLSQTGRKPARAAIIGACALGLAAAPLAVAQVMMAVPAPPAVAPVAPVAPVDAVEGVAEVQPAPPAELPEPPAPPEAPPAGEFDSKSGKVSATFRSRVISTSGDATNGYRIELLQTARNEENEICLADLSGLGSLSVKQGDLVGEGQAVGQSGKNKRMRFSVVCSDDLDETGRPKASPPPVPPVAPMPPTGYAPVAPAAPSLTPAPLRAPKAPRAPSPVSAPAPEAAPSPAPYVARVAPVAPTPPAYAGRAGAVAPAAPVAPTPRTPMVAPVAPPPVTPVTPMVAPPAPPAPVTPPPLKTSERAVIQSEGRVTSVYGERVDPISHTASFHSGVDIAAPMGSPVHSPLGGKVVFAGVKDERGNVVDVLARNGQRVSLAQLGAVNVKLGDTVVAGQVVGTVGSSGRSTGPHLHIEVSVDGQTQDPEKVGGLALLAERQD